MKKKIIAEIGSVHDGSFGNALKLIELTAKCGADCVKFQTHIAEAESLPSAPSPSYFSEESRIEYFKRTSFSLNQWKQLKNKADECDVGFLSTPFSLEAVDLLEGIGVFAYKIASGEVTNIPLLHKIANIGKPVYISSGMSDWQELDTAVRIFQSKCDITVMQCSSAYPCPLEKVGLNVLGEIRNRYKCAIGLSDHSPGTSASVAAASLGATVIEKHLTFSKHMYGSDAKHSMEPAEFSSYVQSVKDVWEMLENPVDKDDISPYCEMKHIFQKSIVASEDLQSGTVLNIKNLAFKKPGNGIPASEYKNVVGKKLKRSIKYNEKIQLKELE
jgi:N,N'-diacetyllegionaminate synthase